MGKDLYSVLGVPKESTPNQLKTAYRKLAIEHHPDKGGDENVFKEIQGAYEVLSDPEKRAFYDQTGQIPGEGGGGNQEGPGGGFPFPFPFGGGGGMPFGFDMRDLFGGGRSRQQQNQQREKAPSRSTQLPLNLSDFYHGKTLNIRLDKQKFCASCKGEGCKSFSSCANCHGSGMAKQIIQMGPMMMESHGPCGACQGQGKKKGEACGDCSSSGFTKQTKDLQILIKPGMKPGDTLVFAGESSDVQGYKEAGDVIVELQSADEDHTWTREGATLKNRVTISLGESLLGCVCVLDSHPGFNDGLAIQIPPGTQSGATLKYAGLGMPTESSGFGEAHIYVELSLKPDEVETLKSHKILLETLFKTREAPSSDMKIHSV